MSDQSVNFVIDLVKRFPILNDLFQDHIKDHVGDVVPDMFLGDTTRYLVDLWYTSYSRGKPIDRQQLRAILDDLERSYITGNEEVKKLITMSFLRQLPGPGKRGSGIRGMVGPHFAKQLRDIWPEERR